MNTILKQCFTCKKYKLYKEFYKDIKHKDGYLGNCKECVSVFNKKYCKTQKYKETKKKYRSTEKYKEVQRNYNKAYHNTDGYKKKQNEKSNLYSHIHRKERNARQQAYKNIIKSDSCDRCGRNNVKLQFHHNDYNKPLEVETLCILCHAKIPRRKVLVV